MEPIYSPVVAPIYLVICLLSVRGRLYWKMGQLGTLLLAEVGRCVFN